MAKGKYKIKRHGDGIFSVWMLKDYGEGRAWIDTGKRYPTEKKVLEYSKRDHGKDDNENLV